MRRRGWKKSSGGTIESYERHVCGLMLRVWRVLGAVHWSGRCWRYAVRHGDTPEEVAAIVEAQALRLLEREAKALKP